MFYRLIQGDSDETIGYFKSLEDLKAFIKLNNYCYVNHRSRDLDNIDKILDDANEVKLCTLLDGYYINLCYMWTRPKGNYDFLDDSDIF